MTETVWLTSRDPDDLLDYHRMKGEKRRLRLLAGACVRRMHTVLPAFADPAFERLIEVVEGFADGTRDRTEFVAARKPFRQAVRALGPKLREPEASAASVFDCLTQDAMEGMTAAIANALFVIRKASPDGRAIGKVERAAQADLIRDIFGNPFRPVAFAPGWRTDTVVSLARGMFESREFAAMPILADALQDAGCENPDVLTHCRDPNGVHVRGCWVVDGVLGRE